MPPVEIVCVEPKAILVACADYPIFGPYIGAATCYQDECFDFVQEWVDGKYRDLVNANDPEIKKMYNLIGQCVQSGHTSVLEHTYFTFKMRMSRVASHQLVRTRHAGYSQKSQRYTVEGNRVEIIMPPSIARNSLAAQMFVDNISDTFTMLRDAPEFEGIPQEDLRFLYPNATSTIVTMTINLRAVLIFLHERLCTCAQWEIRMIAKQMLAAIRKVMVPVNEFGEDQAYARWFDQNYAAKCIHLGYCPENRKRTCGLRPLKDDVFSVYESHKHLVRSKLYCRIIKVVSKMSKLSKNIYH